MLLLGGSALYAFAVRLLVALTPRAPFGRAITLALLAAATLLLPGGLAPACLAIGWLLTFALGQRTGWGLFALGAALMGRAAIPKTLWLDPVGQPAPATIVVLVALTVAAAIGVPASGPARSHRWRRPLAAATAARGLLRNAARRYAPRGRDDAWRIRAVDALARAGVALNSSAGCPDSWPRGDELAQVVCGALELLADGDPCGAAAHLAMSRAGSPDGGGVSGRRSEPMRGWLEVAAWCELATRLIASEEDAQ